MPAPTPAATRSPEVLAAPSPTTLPLPPELRAACAHVRLATFAEVRRNWKTVTAELYEAWRAGHRTRDPRFKQILPSPEAFFPDDTQSIGEAVSILANACGLPEEPATASPEPRPVVQLSADAVAGVRMQVFARQAELMLRDRLGPPTQELLPGCAGESGKLLEWGTLHVLLSNEGRGEVRLVGWSVRSGATRFRYVLPYGVRLGDSVRAALRRVPAAHGEDASGEGAGGYVISTQRQPGMYWTARSAGAKVVDEISYNDWGCD